MRSLTSILQIIFIHTITVFIIGPGEIFAAEKVSEPVWGVIPEETESYRLGQEQLAQFSNTPKFLKETKVEQDFRNACTQLDRKCLKYLRANKNRSLQSLPDNPAYWHAYQSLLSVTPLSRVPEDLEHIQNSGLIIEATRTWAMHEILTEKTLSVKDLQFVMGAHRRLLAEANYLIDKMIFLSTTGITMQAINVLMAQHAEGYQVLSAAETVLLDQMLKPLNKAELSLRRSFHGEAYHWNVNQKDKPDANIEPINRDLHGIRDYVVSRSETIWQDFWSHGMDVVAEVPVYSIEVGLAAGAYADYLKNIRYLDTQLALLRGLREMYEGKASPGIPALLPPALFQWQWRDSALCLAPENIHASFGEVPDICMDYLL